MELKIFIVDDDLFWTSMLSEILKNLKYKNITTFSNGTDCVNSLHLNPKLIFLDYEMGDMNGLEVLKKIKAFNPDIAVVFSTAIEDLNIALNAMEYDKCDYLLKSNASKKEVQTLIRNLRRH